MPLIGDLRAPGPDPRREFGDDRAGGDALEFLPEQGQHPGHVRRGHRGATLGQPRRRVRRRSCGTAAMIPRTRGHHRGEPREVAEWRDLVEVVGGGDADHVRQARGLTHQASEAVVARGGDRGDPEARSRPTVSRMFGKQASHGPANVPLPRLMLTAAIFRVALRATTRPSAAIRSDSKLPSARDWSRLRQHRGFSIAIVPPARIPGWR